MREAQERVEIERKRANKRRLEHGRFDLTVGLPVLPDDTLSQDVTDMCQRLFSDI